MILGAWHRRRAQARAEREAAELASQRAQADWTRVHETVDPLRRHLQLNGWTDNILTIFGGGRKQKDGY